MTKIAAVSLLTYLFVCGCKTTETPTERASASLDNKAIVMKIVCTPNNHLEQDIVFRLKNRLGTDIETKDLMESVEIHALFPLSRTPLYKVQDLETDLKQIPGVISVDLSWSGVPADGNRPFTDGRGRPLTAN
ncbi:hypothetical protein [Dinghuibacter silviterrae]|uniref:Uncharacterized protein n=1 Tax=Dinghuibacter silviterrae TaxID=1539049 RepID=A0A4R8DSU3_9BACT|nr:hypothetical protein [Dinghuibacter silviterrae]TDX01342.1 hypothetical protein EDB95_2376 [Dinghuibacter silviterrae]